MKGTVEHREGLQALQRNTAWCLSVALLVLLALGLALAGALSLGDLYLAKAATIYGGGAGLLFHRLPRHQPWRRFGPANQVTLARLVLAALAGGLVTEQAPGVAWAAVALGTLVVSLDGADGWLARRSGMSSVFGARFDME